VRVEAACEAEALAPAPPAIRLTLAPLDAFFLFNLLLFLSMAGTVYHRRLMQLSGRTVLGRVHVLCRAGYHGHRAGVGWISPFVGSRLAAGSGAGGYPGALCRRLSFWAGSDSMTTSFSVSATTNWCTSSIPSLPALVVRQMLVVTGVHHGGLTRLTIVLTVLGLGAVWEICEYAALLTIPHQWRGRLRQQHAGSDGQRLWRLGISSRASAWLREAAAMEATMTAPQKQHSRTRWLVVVALLVTLTALALWSPVTRTELREFPGRMKTRVLDAATREVRRQVRGRMEARAFRTDLGIEQMIARLFDRTQDPITRYRDAYRLAKAGTPEAVAALQRFFQTATVPEKAAIAQLLGSWGNPRCKPWLWMLLDDPK